jgi:DNA-binding XRE family transcriptional regulator
MVKVREYRLKARLSQSELAKRAGIDDRTVKRCEDGQAIQDVKAAAIADALSEALNQTLTIEDLEISIYP